MKFRSDINGLRSIAVLAVVLYHFNVSFFNGGFVGVDVFFVISGFLMTSIIIGRIDNDKFSVVAFYLDRARRIIPPLSMLIVALLAICWFILIPVDYETLARHAYTSVSFLSNIVYLNEINYFDASADQKWLLHTWSLSVEWQFYIIYPIILLIFKNILGRKSLPPLIIGGFAASLFTSMYLSYNGSQSDSFYLFHTRAWELLAGAIVYLLPICNSKRINLSLYTFGIISIAGSVLLLTKYDVWPGYLTIIPVIATSAIIYSNVETPIFSNIIAQFIGRISYSVYLWHWPVVVWMAYFSYSTNISTLMGILASLALGAISFYLIEEPSRKLLRKVPNKIPFELAPIAVIFLIPFSTAFAISSEKGIPSRFPFSLLTNEQITRERNRYWVDGDKAHPVPKNGNKKFVIIGNSHGVDLTYSLVENGFHGDITYIRTTNLCSNFGATPNVPENADVCNAVMKTVMNSPALSGADYVLLHDDWAKPDYNRLKEVVYMIREKTSAPIYVFGPKMIFTENPSVIASKAMSDRQSTVQMINLYAKGFYQSYRFRQDTDIAKTIDNDEFRKINVTYVSTLKLQCGDKTLCEILDDKTKEFYYFDISHFTSYGAKNFGEKLLMAHPELFPSA